VGESSDTKSESERYWHEPGVPVETERMNQKKSDVDDEKYLEGILITFH
jgi:hypothetical protein